MSWSRPFEDPINLPNGRTLSTLRDAAAYIMALPGKTRQSDEWQAAIEALLMAAEDRGPLMHARIGMMRALNRDVERTFDSSRKDTHWESGSSRGTNDDCLDLRRYQVPSWPPRLYQGFCQSGRRGRMVQAERSRRRRV